MDLGDFLWVAEAYMHARGLEFVDDSAPKESKPDTQGSGSKRATAYVPTDSITPFGLDADTANSIRQSMASARAYDPANPGPLTVDELLAEQRRVFPNSRPPV